ncbi:lipocalin family protein [Spirosoma sp. 209]|uniref:lipocalin family protein n=1 Tax=Spirosoma sp. 209 TaxID=1955701 RepID=UPI00098D4618|nr:lipocalin family protein [Spirosoma sp. 209]
MKRSLYVFCLLGLITLLNACKNDDPAPVSPIVGRWELSRGLLSGFPASSNINGAAIDLYYFESLGSTIDIYADNTFNTNYKNVTVDDAPGTWEFSNNSLTLKYDTGDQDVYTYSKNKNIEELTLTTPVSYTLPVSSTATVQGQITTIYRK